MPKIPKVYSQVGLPAAGASSAGLRVPRGEGAGIAHLGQDLTSIALLYPSFQAAQHRRDAIAAQQADFERSLLANGEIISGRGQFAAEVRKVMQDMDAAGNYTSYQVDDGSGQMQAVDPETYMSQQLGKLFYQRADQLRQTYDAKTAAMVGDELQKEALAAYSSFSSEVLKKRIEHSKGQLTGQLDALRQVASDPTDPRRDKDELLGLSLIDQAERSGSLTAEEAATKRKDFSASVHDTRWTLLAQSQPEALLQIQADLASGRDYALPQGMDPAKFDNYVKMAQGTIATRQSQADRLEEARKKANTQRLDQLESDMTARAYDHDISYELERDRRSLDDRYSKLKALNRTLTEAREKDVKAGDVTLSKNNRFPLMVAAKGAKFTGDFRTINESAVSKEVAEGRLLPEDGEAVLTAITEARAYQRTADSDKNRQIGKAEEVLKANFSVPANETKYSSQVTDLKAQALSRFFTELEQNPNQDPYVLTERIMTDYRPLMIRAKGVAVEDMTEQLRGAMKQFPRDLFVPGTFQMDQAKTDKAVAAGAISKAAVAQYRSLFETRAGLIEERDDRPAPATTKPKRGGGGFFGKGE